MKLINIRERLRTVEIPADLVFGDIERLTDAEKAALVPDLIAMIRANLSIEFGDATSPW